MIRANGFTLVELLAAMVVGSLLLVSLGWVVNGFTREVRPTAVEREALRVAVAGQVVTRLVGAAVPTTATGAQIDVTPMIATTTISPPAALGDVGPLQMQLSVRKEGDGQSLYASFKPSDDNQSLATAAMLPIKIAGGFKSIQLSTSEDGSSRDLRVTFDGAETRTIFAANDISSSGACRFDAISGSCR